MEEYKQITSFETLRKMLLDEKYNGRLDKPLAYWALPSDRRLPQAFLGRTLRDLLSQSYEELATTPGVGRKKMGSLIRLLARATKEEPTPDAIVVESVVVKKSAADRSGHVHDFNPAVVSEAIWEQWCATVRRHGVEQEKLGRLVPSLQSLPTVIWQSSLATYLEYSLAELRQLKTHGEKRVRVILEVFHAVHEVLGKARLESHLTARLMPKFVLSIERWIAAQLHASHGPSKESVRESLALPLVHQIHFDCGPTLGRLVEARLGIHSAAQTVRVQSKRLGVTRARVYQLLEECEQAMNVRWPEGRYLLVLLQQRLATMQPMPEGLAIVRSTVNLFYPDAAETARRREEKSDDTHR